MRIDDDDVPGIEDFDAFGASVAAIDDIDGDGAPDLAVGAAFADADRGAVWLLGIEAAKGTFFVTTQIKIGDRVRRIHRHARRIRPLRRPGAIAR